ncbi:YjzC family protein [Paenibacillus roseipurpureus]|uniref:YjzC family protein n=1 Tax=Paenibacillus roseopurpureus TaxID=2918901 RepID=A0AA96LP06_9BACL|nr:YjzC family protein [Paenibacillus sp. MBLB1832]WNR44573.1 YjzC family protein [Paenibacillus sp. MBLB1832]
MGEWTHFNEGDHVPNDGEYMEIGENAFHMGITNPQTVTLKKGDRFPATSNHNRKWHKKGGKRM